MHLNHIKKQLEKKDQNDRNQIKLPQEKKRKIKNSSSLDKLPEHLKKSITDLSENGQEQNTGKRSAMDKAGMSIAEKYVRQSVSPLKRGEGEKFLSDLKNIEKVSASSEQYKSESDNSIKSDKVQAGYSKVQFGEFPVSPERFVFNQLGKNKDDSPYFIRETEQENRDEFKTNREKNSSFNKEQKEYTDSGIKRIAKLLALLGKDEAANILKSFSAAEIERIAAELLRIKQIDHDEASELLKIIHKKNTKSEIFTGGVDKAREILTQAYGKDKGEEILKKSLPENREKPFEFLNDIEPLQMKMILKNESPTITAIILSHLKPEKSAALLNEYSTEEQKNLVLKMSQKGRISSEIVEKIENGLKEKIREQGKIVTKEIDGKNRLAGILRFMDPEEEERILDEITDEDPDLSKEIDSKIFNIDIIHDIPDKDFQKILNDFSETEIAMILKGQKRQD